MTTEGNAAGTARIVVFGATGYTGRLVTAELVAAGHRPILAGRTAHRVGALAAAYRGLETVVADAGDEASVARLVGPGDVLVTTVGPFNRFGRPVVAAAAEAGAHYLDCAGEGSFLRHVFTEIGPRATASGAALIPGAGYDFVPGNLAGTLALRAAGDAARALEIGYFVSGAIGISSGTRATLLASLTEPNYALRGGGLVERPLGREVRYFGADDDQPAGNRRGRGRGRPALLWSGSEQLVLPRLAPGLTDVATYIGGVDRGIRAAQALSYPLSGLRRFPPTRAVLRRAADAALRTSGRGPDRAARDRTLTTVVAVARDASGRELATIRLEGRDPYTFTGRIMAWMAGHLAAGNVAHAGALGPVDAFGVDDLERATALAGLRRTA